MTFKYDHNEDNTLPSKQNKRLCVLHYEVNNVTTVFLQS